MSTATLDRSAGHDPGLGASTDAWVGFNAGPWQHSIDVRDFIQRNYTPYEGEADFLVGPTHRTTALWQRLTVMFPTERAKGVYDIDVATPAGVTAYAPGYIDRDREIIVGLQTDAPLKRAIMPYGGWRMVEDALTTYMERSREVTKDRPVLIDQFLENATEVDVDCLADGRRPRVAVSVRSRRPLPANLRA